MLFSLAFCSKISDLRYGYIGREILLNSSILVPLFIVSCDLLVFTESSEANPEMLSEVFKAKLSSGYLCSLRSLYVI